MRRSKSHWQPVRWESLPGLAADNIHEAWPAWVQSCLLPPPQLAHLCPEVRRLASTNAPSPQIWRWMQINLQPYRVQALDGKAQGLLTAYYEPLLVAKRQADAQFRYPLYALPSGLQEGKPWFTRQQIETLPQAVAALRGKELAWLRDPIDSLILHIQGSGRLDITEANGKRHQVRMAFAATNNRPYASVGRWLLDRGLVRDATWPGISAWVAANPSRVQEMLWSNPRYVFFKEESLDGSARDSSSLGPRGAQGVALTPKRSIAVDRASIPYGTPVWLHTTGPTQRLSRLVLAQDTGSAITGAVRADYFMGLGKEAGDIAGRTKQDLWLWVLWPKGVAVPR